MKDKTIRFLDSPDVARFARKSTKQNGKLAITLMRRAKPDSLGQKSKNFIPCLKKLNIRSYSQLWIIHVLKILRIL